MSADEQTVPLPRGYRAWGMHCGIKNRRPDLALVVSDSPATAAGMFTQIATRAPSVILNEEKLAAGRARAVFVNSGNANACTGAQGFDDARAMSAVAAQALGLDEAAVLSASTGVIGRPLPIDRIVEATPRLVSALSPDGMGEAARAMMTTDAFPKTAHTEVNLGDGAVTVTGIAKGAGMIHPNMATMIAIVVTDAAAEAGVLRRALWSAVEPTFNSISVDGDTSTSDSVFLLANGGAGLDPIEDSGARYDAFVEALTGITGRLARMIVQDGEGTKRLVEIAVEGARSSEDARLVGNAVMTSLLVKTAFHGAELNWGRISAAAGRSGAEIDPDRLSIAIGDAEVVHDGVGVEEAYEAAQPFLEEPEVRVTIGLGLGEGAFRGLTGDLGVEYVKLNSGYLT